MRHIRTPNPQPRTYAHPGWSYAQSPNLYKPWLTPRKADLSPCVCWLCHLSPCGLTGFLALTPPCVPGQDNPPGQTESQRGGCSDSTEEKEDLILSSSFIPWLKRLRGKDLRHFAGYRQSLRNWELERDLIRVEALEEPCLPAPPRLVLTQFSYTAYSHMPRNGATPSGRSQGTPSLTKLVHENITLSVTIQFLDPLTLV